MKKIAFFLLGFFTVTGFLASLSHASCIARAEEESARDISAVTAEDNKPSRLERARRTRADAALENAGRMRTEEATND